MFFPSGSLFSKMGRKITEGQVIPMSDYRRMYEEKKTTLEECLKLIRSNDNMVSINAIMEIDLTGQVNSETIGTRQYSGPGGAFDFAYGAAHSKGGRSILIMHSTTNKGESKIKATLPVGAAVTIPRTYTDYVVTEYGIAHLRGRSVRDRVKALVSIAHPDVREELLSEARRLFYI